MTQVACLQPMVNHAGTDIQTAVHGGTHVGAGGYALKEAAAHEEPTQEQAPGRICDPWREANARICFLAGPVACGGPTLEQFIPEGLYPVGGTYTME